MASDSPPGPSRDLTFLAFASALEIESFLGLSDFCLKIVCCRLSFLLSMASISSAFGLYILFYIRFCFFSRSFSPMLSRTLLDESRSSTGRKRPRPRPLGHKNAPRPLSRFSCHDPAIRSAVFRSFPRPPLRNPFPPHSRTYQWLTFVSALQYPTSLDHSRIGSLSPLFLRLGSFFSPRRTGIILFLPEFLPRRSKVVSYGGGVSLRSRPFLNFRRDGTEGGLWTPA